MAAKSILDNTSKFVGKNLSSVEVREIRLKRSNGDSLKLLAAEYGLSQAMISKIARKLVYKHVK